MSLLRPFASRLNKSLVASTSTDIYANLALEDWLYRNGRFRDTDLLMFWRNKPCVVIGRHQNPFLEADLSSGCKLARRNSGGGTVYHDEGNLNMTFFTSRERYKRRDNLETIARAVRREYGLRMEVTKREDLEVDGRKVSGTAAKLGRTVAYHHCTLLVDADEGRLREALRKDGSAGIATTATRSVPSPVVNLRERVPEVTVERLVTAIGEEFAEGRCAVVNAEPTEDNYEGLDGIKEALGGWGWVFGMTPKFTVTRTEDRFSVCLTVEKCLVTDVHFTLPTDFADEILSLRGCKYTSETGSYLDRIIANANRERLVG